MKLLTDTSQKNTFKDSVSKQQRFPNNGL
jgi:hypothetical protein